MDYIRRKAPPDRAATSAKHIVTALRSFFRFARYRDYVHADLAAAVPSVAGWSMASIPRAMPGDCVRALLNASKESRTPVGLRNRAILLLLARLGLRAGEVVDLLPRQRSTFQAHIFSQEEITRLLAASLQRRRGAKPISRWSRYAIFGLLSVTGRHHQRGKAWR